MTQQQRKTFTVHVKFKKKLIILFDRRENRWTSTDCNLTKNNIIYWCKNILYIQFEVSGAKVSGVSRY